MDLKLLSAISGAIAVLIGLYYSLKLLILVFSGWFGFFWILTPIHILAIVLSSMVARKVYLKKQELTPSEIIGFGIVVVIILLARYVHPLI